MSEFWDPAPGSRRRWAILAIASINFVVSMFYRGSIAVISPALVRDLGLSSSQLGDLSAVFYYAFAACQIPVGIALDRVGARATVAVLSLAGVGGAVLFAVGQSPEHLVVARALLGIGMSGNLMVVLTLLVAWFPVDRFAFLSGMVVCIGVLGNLLAATPLALLNLAVGWRASFRIFAEVNAVVVILFLLLVKERPPGHSALSWRPRSLASGLRQLVGMYSYWAISYASFVRFGYFAALQSLWAAPFLIYGLGWGEVAAGNGLLSMAVGYMVGLPFCGYASDRLLRSRKWTVLPAFACFAAIALSGAWLTPATAYWMVLAAFFGLGFMSAPGQILYAHMKELMPQAMVAQGLTSVNLFTSLGAGVMTHVLAWLVGGEPSSLLGPTAFEWFWYVGALTLGTACVVYGLVPESGALGTQGT
jgi:MFS family permease